MSDANVRLQAGHPAGEVLQGAAEGAPRAAVIEQLRADGSVVIRAGELGGRALGPRSRSSRKATFADDL